MHGEPEHQQAEAALQSVCTTLRTLFAGAERDEVLTRREIGAILRNVNGMPHRYGAQAIDRVAEELGHNRRELYRYIAVAETWTEPALRALTARTNRYGRPLSWSHLLLLTRASSAGEIDALIVMSLDNAWSVRELASHMDELVGNRLDGDDAEPVDGAVRSALKEGIQTGHRAVADVRMFGNALAERLADGGAPLDDDLLSRAVETYEELRVRTDAALEQLRAARGSGTRIKCAAPATRLAKSAELPEDEDELLEEPAPRRARVRG